MANPPSPIRPRAAAEMAAAIRARGALRQQQHLAARSEDGHDLVQDGALQRTLGGQATDPEGREAKEARERASEVEADMRRLLNIKGVTLEERRQRIVDKETGRLLRLARSGLRANARERARNGTLKEARKPKPLPAWLALEQGRHQDAAGVRRMDEARSPGGGGR